MSSTADVNEKKDSKTTVIEDAEDITSEEIMYYKEELARFTNGRRAVFADLTDEEIRDLYIYVNESLSLDPYVEGLSTISGIVNDKIINAWLQIIEVVTKDIPDGVFPKVNKGAGILGKAAMGFSYADNILGIYRTGDRKYHKALAADNISAGLTFFGGLGGAIIGYFFDEDIAELYMRMAYDTEYVMDITMEEFNQATRGMSDGEKHTRLRRHIVAVESPNADPQPFNTVLWFENMLENAWEGDEKIRAQWSEETARKKEKHAETMESSRAQQERFNQWVADFKKGAGDFFTSIGEFIGGAVESFQLDATSEAYSTLPAATQDFISLEYMLAEFKNMTATFEEAGILDLVIDQGEIHLAWNEELISALGLEDQMVDVQGIMESVSGLLNQFLQEDLIDLTDLLNSEGPFFELGTSFVKNTNDELREEYRQVVEEWRDFGAWLSENEWSGIGPEAEGIRSQLVDAFDALTLFSAQTGQVEGMQIAIAVNSDGPVYVAGYANGGILTGPQIALIGEAGPESVIPLSSNRRKRGIELWRETGEMLGVLQGVPSGSDNVIPFPSPLSNSENVPIWFGSEGDAEEEIFAGLSLSPNVSSGMKGKAKNAMKIKVNVTSNPDYVVHAPDGTDAEDIMSVLRSRSQELATALADDIGGELAGRIEMIYENIPLKGVS